MRFVSIIVFFLICLHTFSQNVDDLFVKKPLLYFSIDKSSVDVNLLSKVVSIDKIKNNRIFCYANKQEFENFLKLSIEYKFELTEIEQLNHTEIKILPAKSKGDGWDFYPTYEKYVEMMKEFEKQYPELCKLDTIGFSVQNRLILAAEISNRNINLQHKPAFFYTSSMHGDELLGYVLMLRLIDYLLSNYGSDNKITRLIDNCRIVINPLANPDGTYYGGNHTVLKAIRYNANMVDLNRNFPDFFYGLYPTGEWQPETKYFMEYAEKQNFVMSANFHGGAELFNYPWDVHEVDDHPDRLWWQFIAKQYIDTVHKYAPEDYLNDFIEGCVYPGIINGGRWYVIYGGRQDYMNYYHHTRELTIEISEAKIPPTKDLDKYWNWNYRSLINFIEQCTFGIQGYVFDKCSNKPIKAKIEILNHDVEYYNTFVFSNETTGKFFRPIKSGTYSIKISAPLYRDTIIENLVVSDFKVTMLNIFLNPLKPQPNFEAVYSCDCSGKVNFINKTIGASSVKFLWDFGDDSSKSSEINPTHYYQSKGNYKVKLIAETCNYRDSIEKIQTIDFEPIELPVIDKPNQYACKDTNFIFVAQSYGENLWLDANKTIIHKGDTLNTDKLKNTAIYYAVRKIRNRLAIATVDTSSTGEFKFSSSNLKITTLKPCHLIGFDIYAQNAGESKIYLLNANDEIIDTINVKIVEGKQTIKTNFFMSEPSEYALKINSNIPLFHISIDKDYAIGNYAIIKSLNNSETCFFKLQIENQHLFRGGKKDRDETGKYLSDKKAHGLIFNSYEEVVLKSIKIFSQSEGPRKIMLFDENGNLLQEKSVYVKEGVNRISLDFNIPRMNNLFLLANAKCQFWIDGDFFSEPYNYPYNIDNKISIESNTLYNNRYYLFFYDWEIEDNEECTSGEVKIEAKIVEKVKPDFNYFITDKTVFFENLSNISGTFFWDFGDNQYSLETNPVHIYADYGNYKVKLTQKNECYEDSLIKIISIENLQPVNNDYSENKSIIIRANSSFVEVITETPGKLELFNSQGQKILSFESSTNYFKICTENLANGIYILKITNNSIVHTFKFIRFQ